MASISHFSIKRSVTTTLIIIVMVLTGLLGLKNMSSQLMPDFDIPVSMVNVIWLGASPEDVDKLITSEVVKAIKGIEGIKSVQGHSSQNASNVVINFKYGTDVDEKIREIQTKVNNIKNDLPKDIQEPIINKIDLNAAPIITYNLYGPDLVELYGVADSTIKPILEKITGVAQVNINGGYEEEIKIETTPERLSAYSLNIATLKNILMASNINMPLGTMKEGDKEFVVKVKGEIKTLEAVKNIVISNNNGNLVKVSDVADVSLGIKDIESYARQNGNDSVRISIVKTKDGNTVSIAKDVKKAMKEMEERVHGAQIALVEDNSVQINESIGAVTEAALIGIVLASIVLFIFLKNTRATLVVAIAIPISIVFTFALLYLKGITLNIISLMGLSLGVGMLVDNSIVVIDNIYRHFIELKEDRITASALGASEMSVPIIAATIAHNAVFIPVIVKEGMAKEIFHDMSYSIIFSLFASLIIALTFVPMATSKFLDPNKSISDEGKIMKRMKDIYDKIINFAFSHKKIILISSTLTLIASLVIGGLFLKVQFMPEMDTGRYSIKGTLAKGLDIQKANDIALAIEDIISKDSYTVDYSVTVKSSDVSISVKIPDKKDRKESIDEVISEIRTKLNTIPDVKLTVAVASNQGGGGGSSSSLQLKLLGTDLESLQEFSGKIVDELRKNPSLVDIQSTATGGNPELTLDIDRDKAQYYGLKVSDIATFVSYQIKGTDAFSIKADGKDINVNVRLKEDYRNGMDKLLNLDISTPNGLVKLKEFASVQVGEGASTISKEDGDYIVTISANPNNIDLSEGTKIMKETFEKSKVSGDIRYKFGGNQEQLADVMGDLLFALIVSVFLIYFILAAQFESFTTPIIIMSSLPLSVIGVVIGLLITKTKFDIMVMIGIIMLGGIVVNNAIVLVDYIKILLEKNYPVEDAVKIAGKTRLRPIIMTTCTTTFGMIPLALGIGQGSEYYQGMAVTVIFGLLFSTFLTLVIIPILYTVEDRIKSKFKKEKKESTSIFKNI